MIFRRLLCPHGVPVQSIHTQIRRRTVQTQVCRILTRATAGLADQQRFSPRQEFVAPLLCEDTRILVVPTCARICADTYIHSIHSINEPALSPRLKDGWVVWSDACPGHTAAWCQLKNTL